MQEIPASIFDYFCVSVFILLAFLQPISWTALTTCCWRQKLDFSGILVSLSQTILMILFDVGYEETVKKLNCLVGIYFM